MTEVKRQADAACLFNFIGGGLLDIPGALLAIALAGESFLLTALFTWLQVERVTLDFLHNVFLLHFALETTQRTFQSFAVLQMYFCQLIHHLPVRIASSRPFQAVSETQLLYCSVIRFGGCCHTVHLTRACALD